MIICRCGSGIGIFLLLRRAVIALLYHDNGCFIDAPYVDQYGESDTDLKYNVHYF